MPVRASGCAQTGAARASSTSRLSSIVPSVFRPPKQMAPGLGCSDASTWKERAAGAGASAAIRLHLSGAPSSANVSLTRPLVSRPPNTNIREPAAAAACAARAVGGSPSTSVALQAHAPPVRIKVCTSLNQVKAAASPESDPSSDSSPLPPSSPLPLPLCASAAPGSCGPKPPKTTTQSPSTVADSLSRGLGARVLCAMAVHVHDPTLSEYASARKPVEALQPPISSTCCPSTQASACLHKRCLRGCPAPKTHASRQTHPVLGLGGSPCVSTRRHDAVPPSLLSVSTHVSLNCSAPPSSLRRKVRQDPGKPCQAKHTHPPPLPPPNSSSSVSDIATAAAPSRLHGASPDTLSTCEATETPASFGKSLPMRPRASKQPSRTSASAKTAPRTAHATSQEKEAAEAGYQCRVPYCVLPATSYTVGVGRGYVREAYSVFANSPSQQRRPLRTAGTARSTTAPDVQVCAPAVSRLMAECAPQEHAFTDSASQVRRVVLQRMHLTEAAHAAQAQARCSARTLGAAER